MKRCPVSNEPVVYLDCQECEDKVCERSVDKSVDNVDNLLWNKLLQHRGHNVVIVSYGDANNPANVALECEDCHEVILDAEIYTLCAREEHRGVTVHDVKQAEFDAAHMFRPLII